MPYDLRPVKDVPDDIVEIATDDDRDSSTTAALRGKNAEMQRNACMDFSYETNKQRITAITNRVASLEDTHCNQQVR